MKLAENFQPYDPFHGALSTFQQKFDELMAQIRGVVVISP